MERNLREEVHVVSSKRNWVSLTLLAAAILLVFSQPALADRLSDAINATPKGTGVGEINTSAATGFLGIPGAPSVNLVIGFFWAIWVGWIFSTVGAFGGIMAGVGHITIFGFGDYASSFKKTVPCTQQTGN
ncbi:hypothetical protein MKHDV_01943 [Halodesulfovibrio sp. MK-HDV]|nr:hypothetical protein MKHDV_01943 [Halodesulfovibrio sp. MK-HDV]